MSAVKLVLERLEGVKRFRAGWTARCPVPAHEDRHASLSVSEGADRRVLLRCFGGCGFEAIVAALGLEPRELFQRHPERVAVASAAGPAQPRRRPVGPRRRPVDAAQLRGWHRALAENDAALERLEQLRGWTWGAIERLELGLDGERVVFPYRDRTGQLVGYAHYQPNPERRNGSPKLKAAAGTSRELFPSPETIEEGGGLLWLLEGEPDSMRALSVGLAAMAVPGVAGWRLEWAQRFAGRRVCLCFDCDTPGREAARRVAADLHGVAAEVRVLDLDPSAEDGFDLTDFLCVARSAGEREEARRILERCAEMAPAFTASEPPTIDDDLPAAAEPFALELDDFIAVSSAAPAALLGPEDAPVLPAGGLLLLAGGPAAGKTTLSTFAAMHLASGVDWLGLSVRQPLRVLVIENEGPREPFRAKLARQRAAWTHPLAGALFVYTNDWGSLTFADAQARAELREFLERQRIDLLIGDPLGSLGVEGVGSPAETRAFVALLRELGLGRDVAFLLLHHNRKSEAANELDELSGDWGKHADAVLGLKQLDGNRARLSFPKLRWAGGRAPSVVLAFEAEAEAFAVVATDEAEAELKAPAGAVREYLLTHGGQATPGEITEHFGIGPTTLRERREALGELGVDYVRQGKSSHYVVRAYPHSHPRPDGRGYGARGANAHGYAESTPHPRHPAPGAARGTESGDLQGVLLPAHPALPTGETPPPWGGLSRGDDEAGSP